MATSADRNTSVALQQKSQQPKRKLSNLTPEELHQGTLDARNIMFEKCVGAEKYAIDVLVPFCEEIIRRYKMQGVAAKDRPNGKPTVDAYFKSINLNYNTVRTWIHRKRVSTEIFQSRQSQSCNKNGKTPHLTQLEAKLLGTASAGHDLVKAIKNGGNVDAAIKDFEEHAPTLDRIEEYIERPIKVVRTEVEKLAIRLCRLIDLNNSNQEDKILALARELLTRLQSDTVQQAPGDKNNRQQRKARKKVSDQPNNVIPPLTQPTNCLEGTAQ